MGTYASFSFLRACLLLCVPYALLCLLLRAIRTKISSRAVYRIGNAKALLFLLPFLPCPSFLRMDSSINLFRPADSLAAGAGTAPSGAPIAADAWMQDTVTAAGHTAFYWVDKALLLFAQSSDFSSPLVFGIRGRKSVLKERVLKISDYTPGGIRKKCTGLLALVLAFLLCALSLPAVSVRSVLAAEEQSAPGTVPEQGYVTLDLSSYFGGMDGSFVLYDCNAGQYQIYNKELAQKRVSPDSVYKVCIALNALENGIIAPENSLLAWDGTKYPLSAWNQNQTLRDAMQNSVNWYFLELDEQLGEERIQQALTDYRYGNMDLSAGVSSYWLESSLKISPEEQTRFFKDFCEGTLPVSQESLDAVRQALLISTDGVGSLYGKTGTGHLDGQDINGWFSGFVETADNTYCFSINLQGGGTGGALAAQTALEIFSDLGIYR